ncbi:hypothetical protein PFICI_01618 [Pestalotiopsis fici W106-1]|uniref:Carboxylic ester hydrolase n=1 Tax=Pestalotiopsis fici (strain W106-1 / CGMCC3.15140) TaxID=1229662 RepID=W3XPA8_PESFW|nr:uncharacterized protein PFICI_01618 [Pestalotiopsis fici W106-1]ETS87790.1 hypothetical protein PFICI_01618 [Pestalotiopsis fici W106-1]
MARLGLSTVAAIFAQAVTSVTATGSEQCSSLTACGISFGEAVSIVNTTSIPASGLNISGTVNTIPFCRVFAEVSYANNHSVGFEVWLPEGTDYNGRFLADIGNGGMAGIVDEAALMLNVNKGFAVAGGDSGHLASENNDGEGSPGVYIPYLHDKDEVSAWIHNSIALFTPPARKVIEYVYGSAPTYSYYLGCSTGGAQGFSLAQFHPELFDGIVAGCPGNWYSHLALSFLWNTIPSTSLGFLPQETLDYIKSAVVSACDEQDGVLDGLIEDPLSCKFDIASLSCAVNESVQCLTTEQLASALHIYGGPHDSRDNSSLYPGFSFGSESEWMYQEDMLADAFTIPILQNLVFDNLTYNASTFNWGSDVDVLDARAGTLIDAINPNLSNFSTRGGKMIVTQGWTDPFNAATWPIQHREQMAAATQGDIDDWFELYMIPGKFPPINKIHPRA